VLILGLTERQDWDCAGPEGRYCVSVLGSGRQIYSIVDRMVWEHKDLEHSRVNGLIKLAANTRLGIVL
jgi:hypothetical protein